MKDRVEYLLDYLKLIKDDADLDRINKVCVEIELELKIL